ncbi:hypothetical protein B0H19DRAFT_1252980 [Mycena capillaripes]|nr:hypothetical protein B0H19DRAFT_1252980 [Mycena capillaripes]
MGRRAKYLTADEATAGHRERARRYNHGLRGKQVRTAARQARNPSKATRKKSKMSIPSPPPPPPRADVTHAPLDPKILQWRVFPLPDEEELFLDALHDARCQDFSPLEVWMPEPPFADDDDAMDPQTLSYFNYTPNIGIALHGLRLRQEQTEDIRCRAAFAAGGEEWRAAHRKELQELLSRWTRVIALPLYPANSRQHAMWFHYSSWLARTIYHLYHLEFLNSPHDVMI